MKASKKITVAELTAEIWAREGVRVIIHTKGNYVCLNYRYSRALDQAHTIGHLRTRIQKRLDKHFAIAPEYTIVLGDGAINPRSDMRMSRARKSYYRVA